MADVLVELRELFEKTRALIEQEKQLSTETVLLIGQLKAYNAAANLNFFEDEYIKALGLTKDSYYKRLAAFNAIEMEPRFLDMLRRGETFISHLAMIYGKLTPANIEVILKGMVGKSKRELKSFLEGVAIDGSFQPTEVKTLVRLELTGAEFALLTRAREILSAQGHVPSEAEVILKSLQALVDTKDPVKKAERAIARNEKKLQLSNPAGQVIEPLEKEVQIDLSKGEVSLSHGNIDEYACKEETQAHRSIGFIPHDGEVRRKYIPRSVRHELIRRSGGQCTFSFDDGRRCPEKAMLEVEHVIPVCRGGRDSMENMTLVCRSHNQYSAEAVLGREFMISKRGGNTYDFSLTASRTS